MRTKIATIKSFFSAPAIAVVGATDNQRKFGNAIYRGMKERKLNIYPVNPGRASVQGDKCYSSLQDLPEKVKSVVVVIPPSATEKLVAQCVEHGVEVLWMQSGSESPIAIQEAKASGITVISKECVLMFLEPVTSAHGFHRWINKAVGIYPN